MNLLLGDSQLRYVSFIPSHISKCWKSGMKLNSIPGEFWLLLPNCDTVVIHLGTNHMPYDSPDWVHRKYLGVIRNIQKIKNNIKIVISGIIPRKEKLKTDLKIWDDWEHLNWKAIATNCLLEDIAARERNVFFLNNWASFTMPNGDIDEKLISADGLHLSYQGVDVLKENIKQEVSFLSDLLIDKHGEGKINLHDKSVKNRSANILKEKCDKKMCSRHESLDGGSRTSTGTSDAKSELRITEANGVGSGCSGAGTSGKEAEGARGGDVRVKQNYNVEGFEGIRVVTETHTSTSTTGSSHGKKSESEKGGETSGVEVKGTRGGDISENDATESTGVECLCMVSERCTSSASGSSRGEKIERKKGSEKVSTEKREERNGKSLQGRNIIRKKCVISGTDGKDGKCINGGKGSKGVQGSGGKSRSIRGKEKQCSSSGSSQINGQSSKLRPAKSELYSTSRMNGGGGSFNEPVGCQNKVGPPVSDSNEHSTTSKKLYPKNCDICKKLLTSKENAYKHKKKCSVSPHFSTEKTKVIVNDRSHVSPCINGKSISNSNSTDKIKFFKKMYPRKCENCEKLITSKENSYKHKKKCLLESKNVLSPKCDAKTKSNVTIGSPRNFFNKKIPTNNTNNISLTESKQISEDTRSCKTETFKMYPKKCDNCDKILISKECAYKHRKKCPIDSSKSLVNKTDTKSLSNSCVNKSMYPKICDFCGKNLLNRKANYIHNKEFCPKIKHALKTVPSDHCYHRKIMKHRRCANCHVEYFSQKSFIKHFKICGKNQIRKNLPCLKHGCISKFKRYSELLHHLNKDHLVENDIISLSFSNISDFNNWKDDEQVDSYMYAINRSSKVHKNKKYIYYACQFDAARFYKPFKTKTSRRKKVGYVPHVFCPSRMFVHVTSDEVKVKYMKTHNHSVAFENVKWHRFPKKFKRKVNLYLARGIDPKKILKYCQENQGENESYEGKKKHTVFATSKQISSWAYELKKSQSLHADDATAVSYWVHKNKEKVLVYKPQGLQTNIGNCDLDVTADANVLFALGIQSNRQYMQLKEGSGDRVLCVDATHCTNQYKFYLVNLVISDCFGKGYPVGHFITNFMTYEVLRSLFSNIMTQHPDLSVSYIMTDDDPALYKAAIDVFGKGNKNLRHLLCKWHIERSWTKQLGVKIRNNEMLRELVYKDLKKLLIMRRRDEFWKFQNIFITKYSRNRHTKAFVDYYVKYYSCKARVKKWAFCYRTFWHFNTDTNMYVEAYHNELKTHWFKRCPNRRLDDLLDTLLAIEINKYLQNFYKKEVGMPTIYDKLGDDNTHNLGVKILDRDVITVISEFLWKICSQRVHEVVYEVEKLRKQCSIPDHCSMKCTLAPCNDLCVHMYQCSCPHVSGLCKHIHKIHIFTKGSSQNFHASLRNVESEHFRERSTCDENIQIENTMKKTFSEMQRLTQKMDVFKDMDFPDQQQVYKSVRLANDIIEASISSDVISPPKLDVPFKISPNTKLQTQKAQLRQTVKNRKIPRQKLQYSASLPSTFSPAIHSQSKLDETLFNVGPYNISLIYLKSLENDLPLDEYYLCKKHDKDFEIGWLYDSIIDAYLSIICSRYITMCMC